MCWFILPWRQAPEEVAAVMPMLEGRNRALKKLSSLFKAAQQEAVELQMLVMFSLRLKIYSWLTHTHAHAHKHTQKHPTPHTGLM